MDIEKCSFEANDKNGRKSAIRGVIYSSNIKSFKIYDCNFVECKTLNFINDTVNGAIAYLFGIKHFKLENCNFNSCDNFRVSIFGYIKYGYLFSIANNECEKAVN